MLYHKDYLQDRVTSDQIKQLILKISQAHQKPAKAKSPPKKKKPLKKTKTQDTAKLSSLEEDDEFWGNVNTKPA